jgi:dTMP kinase
MAKGMFITLEGPDGSGKTSHVEPLADFISSLGYDVRTTREPGGTLIGDQVRAILANTDNTTMQPRTELLLFQASRAQLVDEVILPHLQKGGILLSDRYADSTLAYQGYGHQLPIEKLENVVRFATGGLKPDLTLFLEVDVEEGLRRRASGGDWNRLDAYDLEFHRRAYEGYRRLIAAEPQRWVIVDARPAWEDVQNALRNAIQARLEKLTQ